MVVWTTNLVPLTKPAATYYQPITIRAAMPYNHADTERCIIKMNKEYRQVDLYITNFEPNHMAKKLLSVFGVILLLVGIIGFFNDPIFGVFEVDTMHNIVHLLTGILALIFAGKGEGPAKTFSKVFGIIYLIVTVVGFVQGDSVLGIISVNSADNYLHVLLTIVFLAIGFSGGSTAPTAQAPRV